jgi:hypothetical protein
MAKSETTTHTSGGTTTRTTVTKYGDGSSKSVTREGGNVVWGGRVTSETRTDKKGNSTTKKY